MAEPTVVCPQCKTEIKLTESLAAPLLESVRRDYEQRLTRKDADIAKREKLLHEREATLQKAKETLDEQVAAKLQQERAKIAAEEAKKAKLAFATDLDQKAKEVEDLQEILKERDQKLAEQKNKAGGVSLALCVICIVLAFNFLYYSLSMLVARRLARGQS